MKTVADRIVVEMLPPKTMTAGGLALNPNKQAPQRGTIISKGPEVVVCKEGDEVVFAKHAGTNIEIDDKPYVIMRESDIFAVV